MCSSRRRLLQDVSNSTPGICDACIAKKRLLVTWGQAVHLSCAIKLPEPMSALPVTWFYYSREKGQYQLSFRSVHPGLEIGTPARVRRRNATAVDTVTEGFLVSVHRIEF